MWNGFENKTFVPFHIWIWSNPLKMWWRTAEELSSFYSQIFPGFLRRSFLWGRPAPWGRRMLQLSVFWVQILQRWPASESRQMPPQENLTKKNKKKMTAQFKYPVLTAEKPKESSEPYLLWSAFSFSSVTNVSHFLWLYTDGGVNDKHHILSLKKFVFLQLLGTFLSFFLQTLQNWWKRWTQR